MLRRIRAGCPCWLVCLSLPSRGRNALRKPVVRHTQLLLATGLHGQPLYWTLHVYDFVVWVALAIPTAVVLRLLKPRHLVWYTALATVPYFAWVISFVSNLGFVGQYALLFLAAPATAVALVAFIERRLRPNNSFKPTPLRGAA